MNSLVTAYLYDVKTKTSYSFLFNQDDLRDILENFLNNNEFHKHLTFEEKYREKPWREIPIEEWYATFLIVVEEYMKLPLDVQAKGNHPLNQVLDKTLGAIILYFETRTRLFVENASIVRYDQGKVVFKISSTVDMELPQT